MWRRGAKFLAGLSTFTRGLAIALYSYGDVRSLKQLQEVFRSLGVPVLGGVLAYLRPFFRWVLVLPLWLLLLCVRIPKNPFNFLVSPLDSFLEKRIPAHVHCWKYKPVFLRENGTRVVDQPAATRGLFIIGEHLIWRFSRRSPNRQIKNLAKISRYTV